MKNLSKPIFNFVLLFVLLGLHSSSVTSQEFQDQQEFDYVEGSDKGPVYWGDIHEESACKSGDMQSPINLLDGRVQVVPQLGKLKRDYKPSNATIKNRGHDITLTWVGDAGSIEINGIDYSLKQGHWHSPSEHMINGKRYDLELHMIHQSSDPSVINNIAVVALLYKIGRPDPFLSELMGEIWSIADSKQEKNVGMIDPRHIKMGGRKYYRYVGSLTTPCTEGVIWTINKMVSTVSRLQVQLRRNAVNDIIINYISSSIETFACILNIISYISIDDD